MTDAMTRIDQRFDAVDRRFDAVDRRFDAVDRRFDAVDRRFEALELRMDQLRHDVVHEFGQLQRLLIQMGWGIAALLLVQMIVSVVAISLR